jgi:hypothetical protein
MADPAYIVDGVLTDGEAWVGIATTTLSVDTAVVTFTSTDDGQVGDWSQYMDLVVVIYGQAAHASYSTNRVRVRLNNVTSSSPGYAYQTLSGDGASVAATTGSTGYMAWGDIPGVNSGTNQFGCVIAHLFDINSGKYKSIITQAASDRDGAGNVSVNAFTAKKQDPLTEMDIEQTNALDYTAGSMFSLFGILPRMVA